MIRPAGAPRAAIDLGSNSVLLLVVDADDRTLVDEARVVGLGRGLGDGGRFRPDRLDAAIAALADYARTAAAHGVAPGDVVALTTSAARRAADADAFLARVRDVTGLRLRVIAGEEEARLTRRGALSDPALLPFPDAVALVLDVGGGSTELSVGPSPGAAGWTSLEVGTVRATEAFLGTDRHDPDGLRRLRDHLDALLATFPVAGADVVLGVAGTATTLAAHVRRHADVAADVHGVTLTLADVREVVATFLPLSPAERRARLAVAPDRADWIVAGATIVERALVHAGRSALVVSARDLRHGALAALADADGAVRASVPRV